MISTNKSNRNVLKLQNCVSKLRNQNLKHHSEKSEEQLHPEPPAGEMICTAVHPRKQDRMNCSPGMSATRGYRGRQQSPQKLLGVTGVSPSQQKVS